MARFREWPSGARLFALKDVEDVTESAPISGLFYEKRGQHSDIADFMSPSRGSCFFFKCFDFSSKLDMILVCRDPRSHIGDERVALKGAQSR